MSRVVIVMPTERPSWVDGWVIGARRLRTEDAFLDRLVGSMAVGRSENSAATKTPVPRMAAVRGRGVSIPSVTVPADRYLLSRAGEV